MDMHAAELAFVEALRDATNRNIIKWTIKSDDNRDIYQAAVGGETVEVEFMYFPVSVGNTSEKMLATVCGMKTYFQVAVGTPAYHILREMLAPRQSWDSAVNGLGKATARVRRLIEDS
ncbi:MAG: hypothetical protein ACKVT0_03205 [Planctomycetaceae bacterium]